jgi:hypothetical protein
LGVVISNFQIFYFIYTEINPYTPMNKLRLLCLVIIAINFAGFSQTATAPAGVGTEADPYMINNLENLYWIAANQSAWSSFFVQSADIDAAVTQTWNSGEGWGPIGNSSVKFTGSYNGKGYAISNLFINRESKRDQGLFGYTNGASIDSVKIVNCKIVADDRVGGLIGYSIATNIFDCHASGTVTGDGSVGLLTGRNENSVITYCSSAGSVSGRDEIGGLTGNSDLSQISNCYSSCNVTANYQYAGGLIGYSDKSNVSECFANGSVYSKSNYAGGLIGYLYGSGYVLSDCYATGMTEASAYAGGLAGRIWGVTIRNCYAIGRVTAPTNTGGLTGTDAFSTIENSFWDKESTGQSSNEEGTGKSTAEMKNINTFTDLSTEGLWAAWDFTGNPNNDLLNEDIWQLNPRFNMAYPSLSFYEIPETPVIITRSTDILATTATFEGVLMSLGTSDVIKYGACWNTSGSPDLSDNITAQGQISSSQPVTVSVSGLEPQTTYYVRLYATNSEGTGYSTEFAIRTLPIDPVAPAGEGSPENPYLIETLNNLYWISLNMNEWDKNYVQTAPVNAAVTQNWNSGEGWNPIANNVDRFTGSYNGKGYPIDSLFIRSANSYSGLFGYVDGAQLDSIHLPNVSLGGTVFCGGLSGYARNSSINSCYVKGTIQGTSITGGLTGQAENTKIKHTTSDCQLSGESRIGGIVGLADNASLIDSSLSKGSITGEHYIGGLAGECYATIRNSYTEMTSLNGTTSSDTYFGGLAGACYGAVINSYYNFDSTIIRGENHHTIGVLYDALFREWIGNDMQIDIALHMQKNGDHYLINNVDDLQFLLAFGQDSSLKFRLGADIDMTGKYEFFIPYFSGTLDGNGHTIKKFSLQRDAGFNFIQSIGLFGRTLFARVSNLKMDRFSVTGGSNYVGGLVGHASASHFSDISLTEGWIFGNGSSVGGMIGNTHDSEILHSSFKGSCTGQGSSIGGLIGYHYHSYTAYSFADAEVKGASITGGLVGHNLNSSLIEYSYAAGNTMAGAAVGGFAGSNRGSLIRNCYARANVKGTSLSGSANNAGGFVGYNNEEAQVSGSYATGYLSGTNHLYDGGFCGTNDPGDWEFGPSFINTSYWDTETSGKDYSNGGIGLLTAQMKDENAYSGWDFTQAPYINETQDTMWVIDTTINDGYPFMGWQPFPPIIISEPTDITDTSAIFNGLLHYWRNPTPVQYGLCWNTTGQPTIDDSFVTGDPINNGASDFSLTVSSFEANTAYFMRGYVTHAEGTSYSDELSFNTLPIKPVKPAGDGSVGDPYRVETLMNLYWIIMNAESWNKHFIQVADINAAPTARWHGGGWLPICSNEHEFPPFTGTYDGMGHAIDSLWINREHYGHVGLFGIIQGAFIDSLSVTNVFIDSEESNIGALAGKAEIATVNNCSSSGSVSGGTHTGGLIGKSIGSTIKHSFSTANVKVDTLMEGSVRIYFGGLIGSAEQGSVIEWSYSTGDVAGDMYTGGLTGGNVNNSSITDCYSISNVTGRSHTGGLTGINYYAAIEKSYSAGAVTGIEYTGGLAGRNSNSQITNCYSRTAVSGTTYTGGFTGMNDQGQIDKCYSAGTIEGDDAAGLTHNPGTAVLSSFWDKDLSAISTEGDPGAKSTEEMTQLGTYTLLSTVGLSEPWDFQGTSNNDWMTDDLWHMDTALHHGYPFLSWQQFFAVLSIGADNITETTATISGSLNMWNYPHVLNHGLCWNTSGNPDTTDERTQRGFFPGSAVFQSDLTGLSPETTYYFRAYAVNDTGTVYGEVLSFTTLAETAPVLTAENAISTFRVYPNPARDKVEVMYTDQAGGTWRIDLFTLQGTKILSRDIKGERTNLELHNLPPSVYLLKITDSEGRVAAIRLARQD